MTTANLIHKQHKNEPQQQGQPHQCLQTLLPSLILLILLLLFVTHCVRSHSLDHQVLSAILIQCLEVWGVDGCQYLHCVGSWLGMGCSVSVLVLQTYSQVLEVSLCNYQPPISFTHEGHW